MSVRTALLLSLVLALGIGFLVTGGFLYRAPIGLDQSAWPAGEWIFAFLGRFGEVPHGSIVAGVWAGLSLLLSGGLAFWLVRRGVRAQRTAVDPGRRSFLTGSASGAGAALGAIAVSGLAAGARAFYGVGNGGPGWAAVNREINGGGGPKTHEEWLDAWRGSRVGAYRKLGRTGFEVSDIVFGAGPLKGPDGEQIARLAIDRGVNYLDTSPDYSATGSEELVGKAIRGQRDSLFLATKFCTPKGHLPPGTPVADYKAAVEGSLRRLGTDYVDLIHIHSCDEVDRLMDPNVHEAFDQLKAEGKVRFLGFSSHTPNLVRVANTAIESGRFDVMMLAYHHGIWAPLAEIIQRARSEQDMGVVAMKTLKGAKHHGLAGFREHVDAYSQAALKWVLSNQDVSCAVISFFELQHVDEYLHASGGTPGASDIAALEEYDRQVLGSYCAPHCGKCLEACPEELPIADILRYRMYFEDYGNEKDAMRLYGALPPGLRADRCSGCSAPCLGTCPTGIPIPERMLGAHDLLTMT
jgi:predicted aldo/keto reductase-like oxidoreductase